MISVANKNIERMRLLLTNRCLCACKNCLIEKSDDVIGFAVAKRAIDFFLNNPGCRKILMIYGGEPLLEFPTLEKIITYFNLKIKNSKKKSVISLATNGLLLEKKHLHYFRDNNVKLSISCVGMKSEHDKFRFFPGGEGTHQVLYEKIKMVLTTMPRQNVSCLFCVYPNTSENMVKNFNFLRQMGIKNFNVECIQNIKWSKIKKCKFESNLIKIFDIVFKSIGKNRFLFISSINKYLSMPSFRSNYCLFSQPGVEIDPSGAISFLPFFSILKRSRKNFIIGNLVTNRMQKRFRTCTFNPSSELCQTCSKSYYSNFPVLPGSELYEIRDRLSIKTARHIERGSHKSAILKRYLENVDNRLFQ